MLLRVTMCPIFSLSLRLRDSQRKPSKMFKAKEFKELIGFDHTWFLIIAAVTTGIAFPFIFYGETVEGFMRWPIINTTIGVSIASILIGGNMAIFYKFKPRIGYEQKDELFKRIGYHLIYTVLIGLLINLSMVIMGFNNPSLQNVIVTSVGYLLLSAIYIGIYEAAYYMTALGKSLKMQEQLKRQNVESQLEILKNQVKPHFLFNSLNTLTSLIPDDPDLAVDYVQKLSKVYRYILEIKDKKLIPLQEELDCIKAYLFMLSIRFGENLRTEIDETDLNFNDHIVPLSLQLLVENAVKHNIISSKKPLTIKIHKGKNDSLMVCNNLQRKSQTMPSTKTGLDNIKSRYKILANKEVEVIVTDKDFTVTLPLVKVG